MKNGFRDFELYGALNKHEELSIIWVILNQIMK